MGRLPGGGISSVGLKYSMLSRGERKPDAIVWKGLSFLLDLYKLGARCRPNPT